MSAYSALIPMAVNAAGSISDLTNRNNAQTAAANAQTQAVEQHNQLIAAQQAAQDEQQRNLLDQQQATARAQMGAWGTGGDGGSSDALLQGMAQRSADSIAANDQVAALRMQSPPVNLLTQNSSSDALNTGMGVFQSFYGGMGNSG